MKNQKHTVRKVIDYIEEHLEEELNLEQIAEHAGYSRFHLNRIFMEETGGTIHKYVQERRLTMAAEKLGIDPAVMASPFISTIVDALSLLIYFRFATWILGV